MIDSLKQILQLFLKIKVIQIMETEFLSVIIIEEKSYKLVLMNHAKSHYVIVN